MKIAPELGVCSAIWTFYYNDDAYCQTDDPIVNHEIDIELPGSKCPSEKILGVHYDNLIAATILPFAFNRTSRTCC